MPSTIASAVVWWTGHSLTDGQRHARTTADYVLTDLFGRVLGSASTTEHRICRDATAVAFDVSHTLRDELGHLRGYGHDIADARSLMAAMRSPRVTRKSSSDLSAALTDSVAEARLAAFVLMADDRFVLPASADRTAIRRSPTDSDSADRCFRTLGGATGEIPDASESPTAHRAPETAWTEALTVGLRGCPKRASKHPAMATARRSVGGPEMIERNGSSNL